MFRKIAAVLSLVIAFSAFSNAATITDTDSLSNLLSGASLQLGSITIDGFAETESAIAGAGTATGVDPSTVGVRADLIDNAKIQLTFGDGTGTGLGGFVASVSNGGQYDYLLSFNINGVTAGIQEAMLSQVAGGAGASFANITETILYQNNGSSVGVGLTTDSLASANLADQAALPGNPTSIAVSKDILLQSFTGSSAQISRFSQMYIIPEPASMGLGLLGLLGVVGITRRRRK